jgi:hypothetical protein
VAAWPAVALVGSYELFMTIIRGTRQPGGGVSGAEPVSGAVSGTDPLRGYRLPRCSPPTWRPVAFPRSALSGHGCAWGSRARSRYARISQHSLTGRSAESAQALMPSCLVTRAHITDGSESSRQSLKRAASPNPLVAYRRSCRSNGRWIPAKC